MADQLLLIAHGVTAVLGTWLGLTVLSRSSRMRGASVFALLAFALAVWSVAIIIQRLGVEPGVERLANAVEELAIHLVYPATLHIALTIAIEGNRTRLQSVLLGATYILALTIGVWSAAFPHLKPNLSDTALQIGAIPSEAIGWAWIAVRLAIFSGAAFWIVEAMRRSRGDVGRQRQLAAVLATVLAGATGGALRFLPVVGEEDPWIGVSLVAIAMLLATYAIFAQRIFIAAEVAGHAFRSSMLAGLGVTLYVSTLVILEGLARQALGINIPVVTALALVATIALFEPASGWVRNWFARHSLRAQVQDRLVRAMGGTGLADQTPAQTAEPALARLSRTFDLSGARLTDGSGAVISTHGELTPDDPMAVRFALGRSGEVVFGAKRSQLPFTPGEIQLLELAAGYLAAAMSLAERHEQQVDALTALSVQQAEVEIKGSVLSEALADAETPALDGLHVYALGTLRAERNGELLRQWGGAKAGTRQAEAVFAFLFDRGERGATKDEIVEMIWPDVDLDRADLAFHRTVGGLRSTLEPQRRGRGRGAAISFNNDRYRLEPAIVSWNDVEAFEEMIAAAGRATDPRDAIRNLELARALYRGDYLDDCPFYGDSVHVEDRRQLLRGRYLDLLLALGERYEQRGDRPAAADCFREARLLGGEDFAPAGQALTRLGAG